MRLFRNETLATTTLRIKQEGSESNSNIDEIVSTPGHKYYLPGNTEWRDIGEKLEHESYAALGVKWVSAAHLNPGDRVQLAEIDPLTGESKYGIVVSVKTEVMDEPISVYNLEVEGAHTYHVGKNNVCVHNAGPCHLDPSDIHYTQDSISNTFKKGPHAGEHVDDLIDALKAGTVTPDDIPALQVFKQNGKIYSANNRRLFVYKKAGIKRVPVIWIERSGLWHELTGNGINIIVRGGSRYS